MSNVSVKSIVKFNDNVLKKLDRASITALEQTGQALLTEVQNAEVIPFDSGTLQDNTTVSDYDSSKRGIKISSNTPYARRLYFHPEYNFRKTEHSNAQGKWYEEWITGKNKNFCKDTYGKLYKKEAGV